MCNSILKKKVTFLVNFHNFSVYFIIFSTILLLDIRILQLLDKASPLVYCDYFSSEAWFFSIIYLNLQKDSLKNKEFRNLQM